MLINLILAFFSIWIQAWVRLACFSPTTFSHGTKTYPRTLLVLFEGWVVLDTIIVTSFFNSTICIIWRRALSICTTFYLISSFAPWRKPSIYYYTKVYIF